MAWIVAFKATEYSEHFTTFLIAWICGGLTLGLNILLITRK